MAFLHERQPASLVHVQFGQHVLQHVDDTPLIVHHLFQRHEVCIYFCNPGIHFPCDFEPVARPQQMVHLSGRSLFQWRGTGVFRRDFARRMLPCNLRNTVVHQFRFLRVRQVRVERQHVGHIRVGIFRGQFPTDLHDGTVYLDTEEIFRFAGYRDRCLERDDPVDVRHGRLTDIGVAVPRPAVLPRQAVSRLAVLHDGRYAVIVVRCHIVIARRLGFRVGVFPLFLLPFGQLAFQAVYLCFVRIVLLSVHRRIFHARLGDFFQQVGILILQRIDLRLKDGHLLLRLLQHGVQLG